MGNASLHWGALWKDGHLPRHPDARKIHFDLCVFDSVTWNRLPLYRTKGPTAMKDLLPEHGDIISCGCIWSRGKQYLELGKSHSAEKRKAFSVMTSGHWEAVSVSWEVYVLVNLVWGLNFQRSSTCWKNKRWFMWYFHKLADFLGLTFSKDTSYYESSLNWPWHPLNFGNSGE